MATITIDNRTHQVTDGQNLLQACLSLGYDLPYFCWHPALGSVGACRQCTVKRFKDENDQRGELVMACMTPADDGTRISIDDPEAVQFRASVIEWLMLNHPHDCPVCDEGGECHLQDMTVMTGHNHRQSRFAKRTHRNQDLGPFLNHEMNRCIQCYRCVRFYHDYAGGTDLNAMACHDHVYFGRFSQGPLESPFSGNLVEICPTGVFTDKTLKAHYTRKWDLSTAPTVCVHCGLGCNTITGERYGTLRRVRNRYHHQVNGYFLCDRGRYGYEFVNSERRCTQPRIRSSRKAAPRPAAKARALDRAAAMLADRDRVIGIGSPHAFLEANYALRVLVGEDRFFAGVSAGEDACLAAGLNVLQQGPAPAPTLQGMGLADAALVLGEDVTRTAPLMALNLRRMRYRRAAGIAAQFRLPDWNDAAVRDIAQLHRPALFIASPFPTQLDNEARRTLRADPDDLVRLARALTAALDPGAAAMPDAEPEMRAMAGETARALGEALQPVIVAGTSLGSPALIKAAADIAWCLRRQGCEATLALCLPACNSLGLGLMAASGLNAAFASVDAGMVDTVIVLENDLYRHADAARVDAMLDKVRHVIAIDSLDSRTTARADLILPAATFAEAGGTLVNNEGRAQRSYAVKPATEGMQAGWRWLRDMMRAAGHPQAPSWQALDDVTAELAGTMPAFAAVAGLETGAIRPALQGRIPRQSHRYTGRTAMAAPSHMHEPKPPVDEDAPLAFSMEGDDGQPPPGLIPRVWAPAWNSEQALNKFQSEVGGSLRGGDPGLRLIEPPEADPGRYCDPRPVRRQLPDGEYLLVPVHHVFGSEPLSMAAPGIARRAPQPFLAMDPASAPAAEGQAVRLTAEDWTVDLPLKFVPGTAPRTVGITHGLPGMPVVDRPITVKIKPIPTEDGDG